MENHRNNEKIAHNVFFTSVAALNRVLVNGSAQMNPDAVIWHRYTDTKGNETMHAYKIYAYYALFAAARALQAQQETAQKKEEETA